MTQLNRCMPPPGNNVLSSVHTVWCTNKVLASIFWSSVLMHLYRLSIRALMWAWMRKELEEFIFPWCAKAASQNLLLHMAKIILQWNILFEGPSSFAAVTVGHKTFSGCWGMWVKIWRFKTDFCVLGLFLSALWFGWMCYFSSFRDN